MKVSKRDVYLLCGSIAATGTPKVPPPGRFCNGSTVGIHFAQVDVTRTRTIRDKALTRDGQCDVGTRLDDELPGQRRFVRHHRGSSASEDHRSHRGCASLFVHRTVRAPWYAIHRSGC